jgi:DNA-binding NtrC family response regulator
VAGDRGPRILLAENELATRRLVRRLLQSQGYVVEEASDGKLALGALVSTGFDAVVADSDMPGMEGSSLYHLAMVCAPELSGRFVFIGGSGPLPRGARRVRKPVALPDLLAELRAALRAVDSPGAQ